MKFQQWIRQIGFIAGVVLVSAGTLAVAPSHASGKFMDVGGITSQPIGHFELCKRRPFECSVRRNNVDRVKLTPSVMELISTVNLTVNRTVTPVSDMELFGREEFWTYPIEAGQRGDCEDFALEKRRQLMDAGIEAGNLLLTVVRKPDGEGHAVLTVRTDDGDYILDNLSDHVLDWRDTGYRYLKRQADNNAGRWNTIRGGNVTPVVGAVRSTNL